MTPYLAWWIGGGAAGVVAGVWALRRGNAMSGRATTAAFAAAALGCLYGAKVQQRLRFWPLADAVLVSPSELLTPGYHLPLGLVCGFLAAMLVARAMRASSLRVADALALSGAVMMPIGRIGCMVAGCCTGIVAASWWPFGLRYAPETLAYAEQVSLGVIPADAPMSLPVHPLPAYFAALGLVTAAIEIRLLRRNARPGAAAAAGFALYPLGQLVIERFRPAVDDRGPVMAAVLVAMLVGDLVAVALVRCRERGARPAAAPALALHDA